jgi:hypothetical protein
MSTSKKRCCGLDVHCTKGYISNEMFMKFKPLYEVMANVNFQMPLNFAFCNQRTYRIRYELTYRAGALT